MDDIDVHPLEEAHQERLTRTGEDTFTPVAEHIVR